MPSEKEETPNVSCPTCGSPVEVVQGGEGTAHYRPVAEGSGAPLPTAKEQADRQDFDRMERAAKGLEAGAPLPEADPRRDETLTGKELVEVARNERNEAEPRCTCRGDFRSMDPEKHEKSCARRRQPLPEGEKCDYCNGDGGYRVTSGRGFGAEAVEKTRWVTCERCFGTGKKPLPEAPRCDVCGRRADEEPGTFCEAPDSDGRVCTGQFVATQPEQSHTEEGR